MLPVDVSSHEYTIPRVVKKETLRFPVSVLLHVEADEGVRVLPHMPAEVELEEGARRHRQDRERHRRRQ